MLFILTPTATLSVALTHLHLNSAQSTLLSILSLINRYIQPLKLKEMTKKQISHLLKVFY